MQKTNEHTHTHLMLFLANFFHFEWYERHTFKISVATTHCINYIRFFSHTSHITRHFPIHCEISEKKIILSLIELQSKESRILISLCVVVFLYDSIVWYGIAITRGNMTHRFKTVVVFTWTILHMKHTRYISNWAEQPKSFYLHGKYLYLIRFYFYWCARKHEICNTLTKCVVCAVNLIVKVFGILSEQIIGNC